MGWTFDTTPSTLPTPIPYELRIRSFYLPTGAAIDYDYQFFSGSPSCDPAGEEIAVDEARSIGGALFTRTLRSPDVTGTDRVETTAMVRNINCNEGTGYSDLPYPNSIFFQDNLLNGKDYFWTWVETYAGDDPPDEMDTVSSAEVHRFFMRSYKEFSSDVFSLVPGLPRESGDSEDRLIVHGFYSNSPSYEGRSTLTFEGKTETYMQDWDTVEALRHQQITRSSWYEPDENYCCPPLWDIWDNVVSKTESFSNETTNDVRLCTDLGLPGANQSCRIVKTEFIDFPPFLKPLQGTTTISSDPNGLNGFRDTVHLYDTPRIDEGIWDLGKRIQTVTSDSSDYGFGNP